MSSDLIIETGRVVSVEDDSLWVETIQKSTCQSCSARSGCGQNVLASLVERSHYLRVLLNGRDPGLFHRGSIVKIGIPPAVVATGALIVYLIPLLGMLVGALVAELLFDTTDAVTVLAGFVGFLVGAYTVYRHYLSIKSDVRYQPVLVDDIERECIRVND